MAIDGDSAPTWAGRQWWPHVRAALVAAHIGAVVVLALPDIAGPGSNKTAWKNPTVQSEISAWADRLGMPKEDLEQTAWTVATTWTIWMSQLRAPIEPYSRYAGVRQKWRMFVAPHRYPATLHVDVYEQGAWRPVYLSRSDEHTWNARALDHTRMRSMQFRYAWPQYKRHYRRFARWVARAAFEDFSEASRVRVRWYGFKTPTPAEVRDDAIPRGKFRSARTFDREDVQ